MTGWVLCARCSAVKEHQRRAFCDACEKDIQVVRNRDRHRDTYMVQPEVIRERNRKWKYASKGLVPTRAMPAACELCERPRGALRRGLCLDHCHKTGKFRGWLCGNCNTGIGKLGDNAEGLKRALRYLEQTTGRSDEIDAG